MFYPFRSNFPYFYQIIKNSRIQNLCSIASVESFNKSILYGFPRLNVSNLNSVFVTPISESRTSKLRSIISPNRFWFSSLFYNPLQQIRHVLSSDRKTYLNPNHFSIVIIDDIQCSESSRIEQCVTHKVHTPNFIVGARNFQILTFS